MTVATRPGKNQAVLDEVGVELRQSSDWPPRRAKESAHREVVRPDGLSDTVTWQG